MPRLQTKSFLFLVAYFFFGAIIWLNFLPMILNSFVGVFYALLIPLGLGLLACVRCNHISKNHIGRAQALLLSWLIGSVLIVLIFMLIERYNDYDKLNSLILLIIFLIAPIGFIKSEEVFKIDFADLKQIKILSSIAAVILTVNILQNLFLYSDFPIKDIFQRHHFHYGALQFKNFGILNPFIADSYTPFQQVMFGLLAKGTNTEPMVAEWFLPIALYPIKISAIFVFVQRFLDSPKYQNFAVGLFLSLASVTTLTNGDVAGICTLLFYSLLLKPCNEKHNFNNFWPLSAISITLILLSYFIPSLSLIAVFILLLTLFIAINYNFRNEFLKQACLIGTIVLLGSFFHRSATLGFIIMVFVAMLYVGIIILFHKKSKKLIALSLTLSGTIAILFLSYVLLSKIEYPMQSLGLWHLFDQITKILLNSPMSSLASDPNVSPGIGARVAFFELSQNLSVICIAIILYFLSVTLLKVFKGGNQLEKQKTYFNVILLTNICAILIIIIATGFPFIHRQAFIFLAFVSIITANILEHINYKNNDKNIFIAIIFVTMNILFLWVCFERISSENEILSRLLPLCIAVNLAAVILIIFYLNEKKIKSVFYVLFAAVLFEALIADIFFSRFKYSSESLPKIGSISFISLKSRLTAKKIIDEIDAIGPIFSDPITMATISATSGIPRLTDYSNLRTASDEKKKSHAKVLNKILRGEITNLTYCSEENLSSKLLTNAGWNYFRSRQEKNTGDKSLSLLLLNKNLRPKKLRIIDGIDEAGIDEAGIDGAKLYNPLLKNHSIFVIISSSTLTWLENLQNSKYLFHEDRTLEINQLWRQHFPKAKLIDDAILIKVSC